MLYSCTRMARVGVKGLRLETKWNLEIYTLAATETEITNYFRTKIEIRTEIIC